MTFASPIARPSQGRGGPIARAAFAAFTAASQTATAGTGGNALGAVRRLYPDDRLAARLLWRGAVSPMDTGAELGSTAISDAVIAFVASLAPLSAASRLMALGALSVPLRGVESMPIPFRASEPAPLPWVGEGGEIPVRAYALGARSLGPVRKMGGIVVQSRELARRSGAAAIFGTLLREDAARGLDAALFNDAAASDANPAGLLYDVAPIAAATGGGEAAMVADLADLAGAVTGAGGASVVFVAHPRQAAVVAIRRPDLALPVLASLALAEGTVVALDPAGLAIAFGPEPDIYASSEATIHMSDDPAELVDADGVAAAPMRSLYQSGMVATAVVLDAAATMRAPGLVAHKEGVTW